MHCSAAKQSFTRWYISCEILNVLLELTPPDIPPAIFMIPMASRDAFDGFTFTAFSAKKIHGTVVVIIRPSLIVCPQYFFSNQN